MCVIAVCPPLCSSAPGSCVPPSLCAQMLAERGLCYSNESREDEDLAVSGVHVCVCQNTAQYASILATHIR